MDPTLILFAVAIGAFIIFQVFQGRKRKRETEDRQSKFVPGVEIMTNYGLYGTILSIDDDTNLAIIETMPGTVLKIHRQTILKVADYAPVEEEPAIDAADDTVEGETTSTDASDTSIRFDEPEFGERVDRAPDENPNTNKKVDE